MQIESLLELMGKLRDPKTGCPWDLAQDYRSLAHYTLEEAYEVVDAIESEQIDALPGELGDLLFQVVFYAQLGKEDKAFDFADVVEGIVKKMIRRHPHVFGDKKITLASAQSEHWEKIKQVERAANSTVDNNPSALDDLSHRQPALSHANKIQQRVAQVGFDWDDYSQVIEKVHEELTEVQQAIDQNDKAAIEDEMGDVLFACVNLARHLQVDPETSLRGANRKFEKRFRHLERLMIADGLVMAEQPLTVLEDYWQRVKRALQG